MSLSAFQALSMVSKTFERAYLVTVWHSCLISNKSFLLQLLHLCCVKFFVRILENDYFQHVNESQMNLDEFFAGPIWRKY